MGMLTDLIKTTFLLPLVVLSVLVSLLGPVPSLGVTSGVFSVGGLVVLLARRRVKARLPEVERGTVAFFHPYAENQGGGERVLWCAVKALRNARPHAKIAIYAGAEVTLKQLKDVAERCFNIQDLGEVEIIPLKNRDYVDPAKYRRFTLIFQAIGSIRLAWEGLSLCVPEVFVDTSGWAFCYPLVWLAGARVACYVHYPTISVDMLSRIWGGAALYNNDQNIADSTVLSLVKLAYYQVFATCYGFVGRFPRVVMVNSTWTLNHIRSLWWQFSPPTVVYPPVDSRELQAIPLDRPLKQVYLISVAQFRPEKNHRMQLEAYSLAMQMAERSSDATSEALKATRLKFVGTCRHVDDKNRLEDLKGMVARMGLERNVEFFENMPFSDLKVLLGGAVGGLHTMLDEHFGISIVEYMAAGVIPIAHNSGGPKEDILPGQDGYGNGTKIGYLADTVEEFAQAILDVLTMAQKDRLKISAAARARAGLFSQERFMRDFTASMEPVLPNA
ncbi:hypothetical protein BSKO_00469 [Bryopsis sp. KO-2023]|nr:hypothetical protein BSKO_00469 [Bryopsis sp. KO-2023]